MTNTCPTCKKEAHVSIEHIDVCLTQFVHLTDGGRYSHWVRTATGEHWFASKTKSEYKDVWEQMSKQDVGDEIAGCGDS